MNAYFNTTRLRRAVGMATIALLPLAGCGEIDRSLAVTDPDVIDPRDTRSLDAAEALRLGALARHSQASSGGESFWLLGGLMADEWRSGDTFVQRDQTDQRSVETNNGNVNTAYRFVHRARVAAQIAARALQDNEGDAWKIAEMYVIQAYHDNQLAENMCSGVPFSTIDENLAEVYAGPSTTMEALTIALAHADSALALNVKGGSDSTRTANAAKVVKGRILLNMGRYADAAAAVAGVPTTFAMINEHSETSRDNQIWALNNSAGRWTVSAGEGTNGLNFAIGDPRLPVCRGRSTTHTPTDAFTAAPRCTTTQANAVRTFDSQTPVAYLVQLKWPERGSSAAWVSGIEARLIEAEAQLQANNTVASPAFTTLNTLRATVGLPALVPATTAAGRVDQLFRERAFWLFSTGHRLGDLRRLIRQYGRTSEQVFPTGTWYLGAPYGTDVNFPIPQSEENNPSEGAGQCIDRNA